MAISRLQQDSSTAAPSAPAGTIPALSMQGIRHRFGSITAIDGVDLEVYPREVVCLLGPSGCGKTTLLRLAAGLEPVQEGRIDIAGRPMSPTGPSRPVPPEQRRVGLMFQDSALFPHLRVLDNVTFGLDGMPPARREQRAHALLAQLGMAAHAYSHPHMLSGGQQQRVALARALAPEPPLMLLDEPFSGLDARLRDRIRDDTLHALKSTGAGTLLVTHDPEEAMFMADRIALMKDGRILQVGRPIDLYCNPVDPFVVTFFGDVNRVRGVVENGAVHTIAGTVEVPEHADGTPVEVLIRPEAIHLVPLGQPGGHKSSHVMVSRLLGRTSLIHVCAHGAGGAEVHLHSRMPGVFLPEENQPVVLQLDRSQVFVFPLAPETETAQGEGNP
jgi:iron(III) transport system ATP-binding protein